MDLEWEKFDKWSDVADTTKTQYQFPCIYVVADKDVRPLYYGKTERDGSGGWYGGLRGRYHSVVGALDASMDGSGNALYVAPVAQSKLKEVEKQLIYQAKPKYNRTGKSNPPDSPMVINHRGQAPLF